MLKETEVQAGRQERETRRRYYRNGKETGHKELGER